MHHLQCFYIRINLIEWYFYCNFVQDDLDEILFGNEKLSHIFVININISYISYFLDSKERNPSTFSIEVIVDREKMS